MAKKTSQPKIAAKTAKNADTTILKNPRVTEKAANAAGQSVYVFDVALAATKPEIAKAFAAVYKHVPIKVRTVNVVRKSVFRRTTQGSQVGFGAKGRKAYIYLPKGTNIEIM